MSHSSILCAALSASCLFVTLPAQDQATTLAAAARDADVVVLATVVAVTDPDPDWHRLQFHQDEVLAGQVPTSFSLLEPAGRCCGRSLFALAVGEQRLLFLRRVGPALHPFGGARGVAPASPAIRAHVAALLATTTPAALARLLAENLAHDEPRIADDAAMALACLPQLQLPASGRSAVATALALAVQRGSVRSAALADVAARLADAEMLDAVLPIYLATPRDDQARLLRQALQRSSAALAAERLPIFVGEDRRTNLRAAELLTALPSHTALPTMSNLLRRRCHPQVQLHLCEGLLDAGVDRATLAPLVAEPVLRLAEQRRNRRRTFRNITPQR